MCRNYSETEELW